MGFDLQGSVWGWLVDHNGSTDTWTAFGAIIASFASALAAHRAASAANKTAQKASEEITLQAESIELQKRSVEYTQKQLESLEKPIITAVLRVGHLDPISTALFLDISNYGGLASRLTISRPEIRSTWLNPEEVFQKAFSNVHILSPFVHGIDVLRPRETVSYLVGDADRKWINELTALVLCPPSSVIPRERSDEGSPGAAAPVSPALGRTPEISNDR